MLLPLFQYADWGVLVLRVIFGLVFIAHGWPKLKNLKQTHVWFESIGFKPGVLWGTIAAVLETVGGLLLVLGLLTQIVSILLAIQILVAVIWRIKSSHQFIGGYELDILLIAVGIVFAVNGGASFALDNYWQFVLF